MEAQIGRPILEVRRGRRGARLTPEGEFISRVFREAYTRWHRIPLGRRSVSGYNEEDQDVIIYAGSNDPLVERIIKELVSENVRIKVYWIGSSSGFASVLIGDSDIAGMHLQGKKDYNLWLVRDVGSGYDLKLMKGYMRRIGFISRSKMKFEEVVSKLLNGSLRLANRPVGSGSRRTLEKLICTGSRGECEYVFSRIKGWESEFETYNDVAQAIVMGIADIGLSPESIALQYDLSFIPVHWERFDFVFRDYNKIKIFLDKICNIINKEKIIGYKKAPDSCNIIEV